MTVTFPRPLRRWSFALASLALVAGPAVAPAAASGPVVLPLSGSPRVMPAAVDPGGPPLEDQILIRWRPGTTAADQAATARAYGLSSVPPGAGGLERANARLALTVAPGRSPAAVRRALAGDPRVLAVAANHRRELAADVTGEPFFDEQWGLRNTGQTIDGAGSITAVSGVDIDGSEAATIGLGSPAVVVAVIDNGVDFRNPDLAARAWTNPGEAGAKATNGIDDDHNGFVDDVHGWDFCDDDATVYDGPASGEYGHGTHVAGTIAASLDGIGVVGVAPSVKVMALKALDDDACGSDAQIIEAIDYAATFGIHLINASWGGIEPSTVLDQAIADSGALMIAAAGNSAVDMDVAGADRFYPAASNVPNVISVAAIDQSGHRASFSNIGRTTVDLSAPGTDILSTYPLDGCSGKPCYAFMSGTSMAAPHVTGAAALVGSAADWLLRDPVRLKSRLMSRAKPLAATKGMTVTGGLVNAFRASDVIPPTVKAPSSFTIATGKVLGRSSVAATIGWPAASDAGTGIASYQLRRRSGASTWSTIASALTSKTASSSLGFGTSYVFTLRATDRAANVSATATSATIQPVLYQSGSALATYGPGWDSYPSASASKGFLDSTWKGGASMSFAFTGRSVALVAPKSSTRGSMKVFVDGSYVSTVSLYRPTALAQVVVFSKAWASSGAHTIKLVDVGTAGHSRIDLDAVVVLR